MSTFGREQFCGEQGFGGLSARQYLLALTFLRQQKMSSSGMSKRHAADVRCLARAAGLFSMRMLLDEHPNY